MGCSFTIAHYAETLQAYQAADYEVLSVREFRQRQPIKALVLRHDLDFDARDAVEQLAGIEWGLDCTATYFVRLHGKYNPFSLERMALAFDISRLGHEIGFHYEPGMDKHLRLKAVDYLRTVRNFMRQMYRLDKPILAISQHYAATNCIDLPRFAPQDGDVGGLRDFSGPDWIDGGKYLSDSGGRWREGCFCEWVDRANHILVATHPVWWYVEWPQENF